MVIKTTDKQLLGLSNVLSQTPVFGNSLKFKQLCVIITNCLSGLEEIGWPYDFTVINRWKEGGVLDACCQDSFLTLDGIDSTAL